MIKKDFHVHTTFCDGKNTPEELIVKAISLNIKEIGLVCHAFTPFDKSFCIKSENVNKFIDTVNELKLKYKDKISVFCGTEYDYYSEMCIEKFDYVFGAVHYVYKNGEYLSVDESKSTIIERVNKHYAGNFYEFCIDYYNNLEDIYSKITPKFIAHFDLVSKFNKDGDLFDENNPKYVNAWKKCADKLLSKKAIFELNVGAVCRGYKEYPYPSKAQIEYILKRGGKFIINSDSHKDSMLAYNYDYFANTIGAQNIVDDIL